MCQNGKRGLRLCLPIKGGGAKAPEGLLNKKKSAFTLAEVLITLGIIGIVAAMTLPALIQNYQKKHTVSQLKKAYSVISQALVSSQYDNGDMTEWNLMNLGTTDDYVAIVTSVAHKYFTPYLNVQYDCGITCKRQKNVKRYKLNGDEWIWYNMFTYLIYLTDGTIVGFMIDNSGGKMQILYVYVDLNGDKKPNRLGRDIFVFKFISNTNKINFAGVRLSRDRLLNGSDREICSKSGGDYAGFYCGAVIQYDNREIKDDYPW